MKLLKPDNVRDDTCRFVNQTTFKVVVSFGVHFKFAAFDLH